ncbi:MAG: signal recognition particle-docking protein FtsY [Zetaproteobacteria bacterium]|nr:MAG: signal recognition particle-docking protein FtsY [Zetaproteobacteria bacterium]
MKGLAQRLREGFARTRARLASVWREGDAQSLEAIEEKLILADCGAALASEIAAEIQGARDPKAALRRALRARLAAPPPISWPKEPPMVLLVAGMNGTGKTTTIGKLAAQWAREGRRVLIGAADTFRAAATEQLAAWAKRAGAAIVSGRAGGDPAAVAFDAVQAAKARGMDVAIIDTAGRVHSDAGLMREIAKMRRAVGKALNGAPHEAWIVVDGASGQNAVAQVERFRDAIGATGIVVTKLDGTAKGGIVVQLAARFGIPVRYLGVGEGIEDLVPFDPDAFVEALLE